MSRRPLSSARWHRLRKRVIASTSHCYLCKGARGPLDPSVPWPHELSVEVDHIVSRFHGGDPFDPANCAPVHRVCNLEKGAASAVRPETSVTSRRW